MNNHNPLNCLRCHMTIKQPIRLACQHYFCKECVGSEGCFICGRAFNLLEFQEDKVLSYVVESSQEATETCANCDRVTQPMYFCDTCEQPLCSECRENTHKAKIFLLHHIVQLEERGRIRNKRFCSIHNEPYILFCLDSKSLMCIECFNTTSLERRGHFVNIDIAHKICSDKLEKSAANLRTFHFELKEQVELRKRLLMELEKNEKQLTAQIEQKCEEIINRVNVLKEHLLMKVVDEKAEKEHLITSQMKQFLNLESPVNMNLLSISIFCSYASKIDVLHCYADLYKSAQQFLTANGQLLQKVKIDYLFSNVDFSSEFNQMISHPMGLSEFPTENVFLNCDQSSAVNNYPVQIRQVENDSSARTEDPAIRQYTPDQMENSNEGTQVNNKISNLLFNGDDFSPKSFATNFDSEHFMDPRFAEQFNQIAVPLRKFAQEISLISKHLQDMQRDITLRRCIINGEGLLSRISFCEEAWNRLDAHNLQVQKVLGHLGNLWRHDIQRVQKQQHAVRDKVDEMKQLQRLAQRALKVSQQLKPFANQMANLISMIDVRRSGEIEPSPMERICLEISQIEPDSESRVAAIEKEEESRRLAKQKEEDAQIGKQEALQAKKNLKEVRLVVPKLQRSQIVREMDRDRGNDCSNSSLLSSPLLTTKKRHHLQNRTHRNSEGSTFSDPEATLPKQLLSDEISLDFLLIDNDHPATSTMSSPSNHKEELPDKKINGPALGNNEKTIEEEKLKNSNETRERSPDEITIKPTTSATSNILRSQTQHRDPALILVKERLLESIREKVKRID